MIPSPCDHTMVMAHGPQVTLAVGHAIENEPREWAILTPGEARTLAVQLRQAAATAAAADRRRKRGNGD